MVMVLFKTEVECSVSSGRVVWINVPVKISRCSWAFLFEMAVLKEQSVTTIPFEDAFRKALLNCFQLNCFDSSLRDTDFSVIIILNLLV